MTRPDLSIVVLSWNTADLLVACLRSLERDVTRRTREILVVDNASADGSADRVAAEFPSVRLIRNRENLLYAEGNNQGARAATGEFLCLLNSDTEVTPGALDRLQDFLLANPEYAVASPKLIYPDGRVQAACRRFPKLRDVLLEGKWLGRTKLGKRRLDHAKMSDFDHLTSRDVPQPPGACMVIRRQEFLDLGMFDTVLSLFFNDVDLCRRLDARGRRIRFVAESEVHHHEGASTSKRVEEFGNWLWESNRRCYFRKWDGRLGSAFVAAAITGSACVTTLKILLGRRKLRDKMGAVKRSWAFAGRCLGHR